MPLDWIFGLIGGILIGCAGAVYLLGNGRIMGASSIVGGLVDGSGRAEWRERAAFLAGLVGVPAVLYALGSTVDTQLTPNWAMVIAAGLLVGLGTRIGNGCTSGHGVCGISRMSPRGIVATLVYIGAGALMVIVARAVLGGV